MRRQSIAPTLLLGALTLAVLSNACGDDGGGETSIQTEFVQSPVTVISPEHGATYVGVSPVVLAVLDPSLSSAQRDSVTMAVNGTDVGDRVLDEGSTLTATGLADLMRDGANTVTVSFEGVDHAIGFTFDCAGNCTTPAPRLDGPTEVVEGDQQSLFGANLGTAGDRRLLYIDGTPIEVRGGRWSTSIIPFVGPPASFGSIEVAVEVNGVKSNTVTIALLAAEPLPVTDDDVVDGFVSGVQDLVAAYKAFPPTRTGDPVADGLVAAVRAALEPELDGLLADLSTAQAALPAEAKAYLAQFLRQGALDTLLVGWASDLPKSEPKADGVSDGFDQLCEGSILRAYRTLTFMKFVQDTVNSLTLALSVLAALYPPAFAIVGTLVSFNVTAGKIIGLMELFVNTVLPDIAAATIDVPAIVPRATRVTVTGSVTFEYDPKKKLSGIVDSTINRATGAAIGSMFDSINAVTPFEQAFKQLAENTVDRIQDLSNHLGKWHSDLQAGKPDSPTPNRFTLPAYPLYLDFDAERFELVEGGDPAGCQAIGKWKDDQLCDVEDRWTIGENLAQTSWYERAFSKNLGTGTVKASTSPALGPDPYTNPAYGERMEIFGRDAGCDRMEYCYTTYEGDCGLVSALGEDADCLNMFTGSNCPMEMDYQSALTLCLVCYEG